MMNYLFAAHPTFYSNVMFRSRLEARWAAYLDLIGWKWEYEPLDLKGWTPDFRVTFPCGHSECNGKHVLLVEVKPYYSIAEFEGHPCRDYPFGCSYIDGETVCGGIPADASAAFGVNPTVTEWEMCHGCGGGRYSLADWNACRMDLWETAGEITRYHPRRRQAGV